MGTTFIRKQKYPESSRSSLKRFIITFYFNFILTLANSKISGQNLDIEFFSSFSQFYAFLLKIAVYKFYLKLSRLIRIRLGQNWKKIKKITQLSWPFNLEKCYFKLPDRHCTLTSPSLTYVQALAP